VGLRQQSGIIAITPQFDFAYGFRYGRARVQLGNGWGFIDKDGRYIGSPNLVWSSEFSRDFALVETERRALGVMDRSGKIVLLDKVQAFTSDMSQDLFGSLWREMRVHRRDRQVAYRLLSSRGPETSQTGLRRSSVGRRTGYIDEKGKFVVNPQYDQGNEFNDGYASFANGGKWGSSIRREKKFAPQSSSGWNFSDGLAPTQTEDGWGFIDKTCKLVVSPQFDGADSFQNGLAHVTALGKEAYITTAGAFVVNPFPGTTVLAEKARRAAEAADAAAKAAEAAARANDEAAGAANRERVQRVEQGIAGDGREDSTTTREDGLRLPEVEVPSGLRFNRADGVRHSTVNCSRTEPWF